MFFDQTQKTLRQIFTSAILLIFVGGPIFIPASTQDVETKAQLDSIGAESLLISAKAVSQVPEMTMGQTIEGNLAEADEKLSAGQFVDKYTFVGTTGQKVIISLATFDFDAFLWLLNGAGQVIAINDDAGDGAGALISNFTLPGSGTYTLWASSHDAGETGAYRLTLNEAPLLGSPSPISIGTEVQGQLSDSNPQFNSGQFYQVYRFAATYGQAISIVMRSDQLNAYLWLLDDTGRVIAVNDDARLNAAINDRFVFLPIVIKSGLSPTSQASQPATATEAQENVSLASQIIFIPPVSGNYTLLASSSPPQEQGSYRLALDPIAAPTPAASLSGTVSGQLTSSDFQLNAGQFLDVYTFQGAASQPVTLALNSSAFDSHLRVLDSQGNVIKEDDDSGGGGNALIQNLSLPGTDSYYVWVSSAFSGAIGAYTLSLGAGSATAVGQETQPELLLGPEGSVELFSKQAETGEIGALGKGEPFTNAFQPAGSTAPYTVKVKICIGNNPQPFSGTVNLSGPSGIIIDPASKKFTVNPNNCITLSPFNITFATAAPGVKPISANVPGLGSDSEDLTIVEVTRVELLASNGGALTNNNHPSKPGGLRIFPGKPTPNGSLNNKVKVRITLSDNVPAGELEIYLKSFDVNDPTGLIDNNHGAFIFGTPDEGELSDDDVPTDGDNQVEVDFTVTMQPGDNFKIFASTNEKLIDDLTDKMVENTTNDAGNTTDPKLQPLASDRLTVWRRVHVEVDSMGPVTGNVVTGNITNVSAGSVASIVTTNQNVTETPTAANRFQNGRLINGGNSFPVVFNTQGPNFQITVSNIGIISPTIGTFTLVDDDDFNNDDGPNLDGDAGEDVTAPDTSLMQDSDEATKNVFAEAYVRPTYDIGGNGNVPFVLNTPGSGNNSAAESAELLKTYQFANRATEDDDEFWTVYLLGAYQMQTEEDCDPDAEACTLGQVDDINGQGGSLFKGATREAGTGGACGEASVMAHETGHLFNGIHPHGDLMEEFCNNGTLNFSSDTLKEIRDISHP